MYLTKRSQLTCEEEQEAGDSKDHDSERRVSSSVLSELREDVSRCNSISEWDGRHHQHFHVSNLTSPSQENNSTSDLLCGYRCIVL